MLFRSLISYFFIKTKFINSQNKYFPEIIDANRWRSTSHFNATGCRLWSTGSGRSQSSVVNSMQEGPSEIAVVQISRTEYIMKFYNGVIDQIPQKRILRPWNQRESHCLHRDLTFEIRERAARHVIRTRRNSHLNKSNAKPSSSSRPH